MKVHLPPSYACPACGGGLRPLGEDVAEQLEFTPASFRVIRHVRPKLAFACCDAIVEASAPIRPIERGIAGPGLLAHVLVAKFADHLPLYRQSVIYAHASVDLDRALLASWVVAASALLRPLIEVIRRSTTRSPNGRCVVSPLAGAITCLLVLTAVANASPPSTR